MPEHTRKALDRILRTKDGYPVMMLTAMASTIAL